MSVKFLFSTFIILLITLTFFALDTVADSESTSDRYVEFMPIIFGVLVFLMVVTILYYSMIDTRKERAFLKAHSSKLSSEDPKVLLEFSEKCDAYLKDRDSFEIRRLLTQAKTKLTQAKTKRTSIQFSANLEAFKSEISEDGSHPAVVAMLKEQMHNPDSFQHVSSDYETVEQEGKNYQKIVMAFRGRNTFNALVLQTCYFLVDEDNQISLVGSPDDTESSPVNTVSLAEAADTAAIAVEGVATLADLLSFFTSEE